MHSKEKILNFLMNNKNNINKLKQRTVKLDKSFFYSQNISQLIFF
jgi:hypothetical protein